MDLGVAVANVVEYVVAVFLGIATGCAVNPATGKRQLALI